MLKLRDYQEDIINEIRQHFINGHNAVLLQLGTGGGKCLGKGTPVLMYDGSTKLVEHIIVGDQVMGPDSNLRRVKSVCSGKETLYEVMPVKGESYIVNESHILSLVKTGTNSIDGENIVNLSVRDYIQKNDKFKHMHKGYKVGVDFTCNKPLPNALSPYFLGLWLGDGSSRIPQITTDDIEIVYYLESECLRVLGVNPHLHQSKGKTLTVSLTRGNQTGRKRNDENLFTKSLRQFDLLNNKHIPFIYKTASRLERLELLAGLMDTDGSKHRNGFDYISKVKRLSEDVVFLARSLGLSAYLKECKKTCCNNGVIGTYYRVSIGGDCSIVPVRLERKKPDVRNQKKNVLRTGIKLKCLGIGDYYGFELEGKDGLFLLGDFTVTHNTSTVVEMIKRALGKGNKSWFLCHRSELVSQASRTMNKMNVPHGIIAAGSHMMLLRPVQVCSIPTLARRIAKLKKFPQLIVYDECHHLPAQNWAKSFKYLEKNGCKFIGLTATPQRLDGKGLDDFFSVMVQGPTVAELISQGYLSNYRCFAPSKLDLSGVHTKMGDYAKDELSTLMDKPSVTGDIIVHYNRITPGKKAIVFAVKIEHSQHIAQAFNDAGIPAAHVDGTTPANERQKAIDDFAKGKILVLCNVDLFGEGFDIPDAEVAILARPTQSLALHLQQVGRVLRPIYQEEFAPDTAEERLTSIAGGPKPYAYILDHAGNCLSHGLPDDEREWTLQGREKGRSKNKKPEDQLAVRQCPKCYYVQKSELEVCAHCGHVYEKKGRKIEQVDGELKELTREDKIKMAQERSKQLKSEQGQADSLDKLIQLGKIRGYKQPEAWARYVLKGRGSR